jgi:hypothetical protein
LSILRANISVTDQSFNRRPKALRRSPAAQIPARSFPRGYEFLARAHVAWRSEEHAFLWIADP